MRVQNKQFETSGPSLNCHADLDLPVDLDLDLDIPVRACKNVLNLQLVLDFILYY